MLRTGNHQEDRCSSGIRYCKDGTTTTQDNHISVIATIECPIEPAEAVISRSSTEVVTCLFTEYSKNSVTIYRATGKRIPQLNV